MSARGFAKAIAKYGETKAAVLAAYDGIRTNAEIGEIIGRCPKHVASVLRKHKLPSIKAPASGRHADYQACADAGMTMRECAEALGVTYGAVTHMDKNYGIKFARERAKPASESSSVCFSASPEAIRRYFERSKSSQNRRRVSV